MLPKIKKQVRPISEQASMESRKYIYYLGSTFILIFVYLKTKKKGYGMK
jgi:hypothetical protein